MNRDQYSSLKFLCCSVLKVGLIFTVAYGYWPTDWRTIIASSNLAFKKRQNRLLPALRVPGRTLELKNCNNGNKKISLSDISSNRMNECLFFPVLVKTLYPRQTRRFQFEVEMRR